MVFAIGAFGIENVGLAHTSMVGLSTSRDVAGMIIRLNLGRLFFPSPSRFLPCTINRRTVLDRSGLPFPIFRPPFRLSGRRSVHFARRLLAVTHVCTPKSRLSAVDMLHRCCVWILHPLSPSVPFSCQALYHWTLKGVDSILGFSASC